MKSRTFQITFSLELHERFKGIDVFRAVDKALRWTLLEELEQKVERVHWAPTSHWDEHPKYLVSEWQLEVEQDNTRQSYVEWVNARIEEDEE